jgi:cyanophycinase-like exopeptidase
MKIVVLYHAKSDHARAVEEYQTTFERIRSKKIELLDLETREGANMAQLYDIVQYPAVLALSGSGQLLKEWQGEHLPLMDEVAAYFD